MSQTRKQTSTYKCMLTYSLVHTHINTSACTHSVAYPSPLHFASHSLVWPCNRDSYIRRIFSGPCLLQRGKTSLCHSTSHDHISTGQNVRETRINDLNFVTDFSISFLCLFLLLNTRVCDFAIMSDRALILMTGELWRQCCSF